MTAAKAQAASEANGSLDLSSIRADIARSLQDPSHDDGSLAPLMIRFAWHSCGTYSKESDTGGSDGGTIWLPAEVADPENKGFDKARQLLKQLHAKHGGSLSLADLGILTGCVAIEATGGPHIPFASGRRDFTEAEAIAKNGGSHGGCPFASASFNPLTDSRLPPADCGVAPQCPPGASAAEREAPTIHAVRMTFRRMGFNDSETVALIVLGHQYGRCHPEVSGFEHPWYSFDPTHYNIYESGLGFLSAFGMAEHSYREQRSSRGKRQWNMRMGFGGGLEPFMMLPSDMALVWDPSFKACLRRFDADRTRFKREATEAFKKLCELGCKELKPEL